MKNKGAALLITVMLIAAMTYLITELTYTSRVNISSTQNFVGKMKSYYLARSGVEAAKLLLSYDLEQDREEHSRIDYVAKWQGNPIGQEDIREVWSYFATDRPPIPLRDYGSVKLKIEDEESKVNLNGVNRGNASERGLRDPEIYRFVSFLEKLGVPPEDAETVVFPLIDWIDFNDDPLPDGAETAYYLSLVPPYEARNSMMPDISDLYMIKDFTIKIIKKILPYVTVYPRHRVKEYYINVNTAPAEVLMYLSPRIDLEMAQELVQARSEGPFETMRDFKNALIDIGLSEQEVMDIITYSSKYNIRVRLYSDTFHVVSTGIADGSQTTIDTVLKRDGGDKFEVFYWNKY